MIQEYLSFLHQENVATQLGDAGIDLNIVRTDILGLLQGSKFAVVHEAKVSLEEDNGLRRCGRYPLRT